MGDSVEDEWGKVAAELEIADPYFRPIRFDLREPVGRLVRELIDTRMFQRLRYVRQLSTTYVSFPFADHTRFGHCLGSAEIAMLAVEALIRKAPKRRRQEIEQYRTAVVAAALLHDVGQIAPGSHLAFKVYFPDAEDIHEQYGCWIVEQDQEIRGVLERFDSELPRLVSLIMQEGGQGGDQEGSPPPWTYQLISGGGWNIDRGHWTLLDSVLCGVQYGTYDLHSLIGALVITDAGHLAIEKKGIAPLEHFAVARKQLYKIVYQHRVGLATDAMYQGVARRARELGVGKLPFLDSVMEKVLSTSDPRDLDLNTIAALREYHFFYHLDRWSKGGDQVLADLSDRILHRRIFKTIEIVPEQSNEQEVAARAALEQLGLDPNYYLVTLSKSDVTKKDFKNFLLVWMKEGGLKQVTELGGVFRALAEQPDVLEQRWLALPSEGRELVKK